MILGKFDFYSNLGIKTSIGDKLVYIHAGFFSYISKLLNLKVVG